MRLETDEWRKLARACLLQTAGVEIAVAGDNELDRVIDLVGSGEAPTIRPGGSRGRANDVVEAIKIMVEIATFTKTTIDIYFMLHDRLARHPSREELEEAIPHHASSNAPAVRSTIIAQIYNTLSRL